MAGTSRANRDSAGGALRGGASSRRTPGPAHHGVHRAGGHVTLADEYGLLIKGLAGGIAIALALVLTVIGIVALVMT